MIALFLFSGRNIPSNTNTIHVYCCCVCVVSTFRPEYSVKYKYNILLLSIVTFRPEYSVQYKYNTHSSSLCLCCINFPAGIFCPIQIQYTIHIHHCCLVFILRPEFSGRNIPSNTNTIHIHCSLSLSGRNILSNTNTIHVYCCCVWVVSTFRPEYSVQYKYNTQYTFIIVVLYLYCGRNFPAGIFRPIQIQYIYCCCVRFVFIFRPEFSVLRLLCHFSGRNIPYCIYYVNYTFRNSGRNSGRNSNTIQM